MRTAVKDVHIGEYFLWHGTPYKKMCNVPWGVEAFTLQSKLVWIGCTALVEYDLKKPFPKKTSKINRV